MTVLYEGDHAKEATVNTDARESIEYPLRDPNSPSNMAFGEQGYSSGWAHETLDENGGGGYTAQAQRERAETREANRNLAYTMANTDADWHSRTQK